MFLLEDIMKKRFSFCLIILACVLSLTSCIGKRGTCDRCYEKAVVYKVEVDGSEIYFCKKCKKYVEKNLGLGKPKNNLLSSRGNCYLCGDYGKLHFHLRNFKLIRICDSCKSEFRKINSSKVNVYSSSRKGICDSCYAEGKVYKVEFMGESGELCKQCKKTFEEAVKQLGY